MNPTQQAHQSLRNMLLNGRILINGLPPTANEIGGIIQGEQMLFEKAMKLDKAQEIAAATQKKPKEPKKPKDPKKKPEGLKVGHPQVGPIEGGLGKAE